MHLPLRLTLAILGLVTCTAAADFQAAGRPAPPTVLAPQNLLRRVVTPKSGTLSPVFSSRTSPYSTAMPSPAHHILQLALGGQSAPVEVVLVVDAVNANFQAIAYERQQIETFRKRTATISLIQPRSRSSPMQGPRSSPRDSLAMATPSAQRSTSMRSG